jgi:hypothetical protein
VFVEEAGEGVVPADGVVFQIMNGVSIVVSGGGRAKGDRATGGPIVRIRGERVTPAADHADRSEAL